MDETTLMAAALASSSAPLGAAATRFLLAVHFGVLAAGLLCLCATSASGFLYLLAHRELKRKRFGCLFSFLPPLEVLDRFALRTLVWGFSLLTAGIVSGVYLAHGMWRGDWSTASKVIFSFVTWAWYGLLLLARYRLGWRGARFFSVAVVGFVLLVLTFVGVYWFFESPMRLAALYGEPRWN